MPAYHYRCDTSGDIFTVRHPRTLKISTWMDLCDIGGFAIGNTPIDASVTKQLNSDDLIHHKTLSTPAPSTCIRAVGCPKLGEI